MKDGLYHYVTGLPKVNLPASIPLSYGTHAKHQCVADRYGIIKPPATLDIANGKLIELQVLGGRIEKIVVRIPYDNRHDLVLVVGKDGFVRTLWLNRNNDKHNTLDRTRYVTLNK
jgi:hypothetical protein